MNEFKLEKAEQAKKLTEEKAKEEAAKEEAEKLANPSQEDLLKNIRDLHKAQVATAYEAEKKTKKAE